MGKNLGPRKGIRCLGTGFTGEFFWKNPKIIGMFLDRRSFVCTIRFSLACRDCARQ